MGFVICVYKRNCLDGVLDSYIIDQKSASHTHLATYGISV